MMPTVGLAEKSWRSRPHLQMYFPVVVGVNVRLQRLEGEKVRKIKKRENAI